MIYAAMWIARSSAGNDRFLGCSGLFGSLLDLLGKQGTSGEFFFLRGFFG